MLFKSSKGSTYHYLHYSCGKVVRLERHLILELEDARHKNKLGESTVANNPDSNSIQITLFYTCFFPEKICVIRM